MPKGMPRGRYPELYGGLKPTTPAPEPEDTDAFAVEAEPVDAEPVEPERQIEDEEPQPQQVVEAPPADDDDRARIRQLEARIAELQQAIEAAQNLQPLQASAGGGDPEPVYEAPQDNAENILIHILEDGFTVLGQVWYRGQELEFTPQSPAYRDTIDRTGRSWLELRDNDFAQVERWGKVMFRTGPWPGKSLLDANVQFDQLRSLSGDGSVAPPSKQELAAAAEAEIKRRRAAPRLPMR